MEKRWWAEAFNTALYVINRLPNTIRPAKSPHGMCFGTRFSLQHLRVFGFKGFVHVHSQKRTKLESKAVPCIFLGYASLSKVYRVWDTRSRKIAITRSVVLDERGHSGYTAVINDQHPRWTKSIFDDDEEGKNLHSASITPTGPTAMEVDESARDDEQRQQSAEPMDVEDADNSAPDQVQGGREITAMGQSGGVLRRTSRDDHGNEDLVPQLLDDGIVFTQASARRFGYLYPRLVAPEHGETSIVLVRSQNVAPLSPSRASCAASESVDIVRSDGELARREPKRARLTIEHAHLAFDAPADYDDAMTSPDAKQWRAAMTSELRALARNGTYELVLPPRGAKVIGCKWVYAIQYNEQGETCRFNAPLVARGFQQTRGIDFHETYSPVVNMNSLRVSLAICCQRQLYITQYDVDTVFLNGTLEAEVSMSPPPGVRVAHGHMCRLRRSIDGLKQASTVWYKTTTRVFVESMGFTRCDAAVCIFVRKSGSCTVMTALYVDGMLVASSDRAEIDTVKRNLTAFFAIKDLGAARLILGVEVHYDQHRGRMELLQRSCIERMAEKFDQESAKHTWNPSIIGEDFSTASE